MEKWKKNSGFRGWEIKKKWLDNPIIQSSIKIKSEEKSREKRKREISLSLTAGHRKRISCWDFKLAFGLDGKKSKKISSINLLIYLNSLLLKSIILSAQQASWTQTPDDRSPCLLLTQLHYQKFFRIPCSLFYSLSDIVTQIFCDWSVSVIRFSNYHDQSGWFCWNYLVSNPSRWAKVAEMDQPSLV